MIAVNFNLPCVTLCHEFDQAAIATCLIISHERELHRLLGRIVVVVAAIRLLFDRSVN